jgi:peptidoglycan L-alanyl-D-glutamate endopeptidase CwlK
MAGVDPRLIVIASRALAISEVDFGVSEGLRTEKRQRQLVNSGASKTMDSYHITGHAIDLVAYVGGKVRWDWPLYDQIAEAMWQSARGLNVPLIWGGAWGLSSAEYPTALFAKGAYIELCRSQGKSAWLDGPHFQVNRT